MSARMAAWSEWLVSVALRWIRRPDLSVALAPTRRVQRYYSVVKHNEFL